MMAFLKKGFRNVRWRNEMGFTLVDMLVAFSGFLMMIAFLPLGMKIILPNEYSNERFQKLEWEVFHSQIKKEVRISNAVFVEKERVILLKNGDRITYEKFGTNIRRRVNTSGHEVILQNVASLRFEPLSEGYSITVIDTNGDKHHANVRSFIPIEVQS